MEKTTLADVRPLPQYEAMRDAVRFELDRLIGVN